MLNDIEVWDVKNRKVSKIFLIVIIILLFIIDASITGIYFANIYNNKRIKNKNVELKVINDVINKEDNKPTQLPVYSENAKQLMQTIYTKDTKIAYLTFDDGPSQAVTPLILDLLKQENIKATFFVLGTNVEKNPELVLRAYQEGHYIANHGYNHSYSIIYSNPERILEEYNKTELCIQQAINNSEYHSYLFRFPGGYNGGKYSAIKKEAGRILNDNNISFIDWNCLSGDAEGANTKEKIMEYIQKYTLDKNNVVILMHDSSSKILTYETLTDIISYLKELGYTFDNFYNIMK